jgi:hypothetical protein
MKPHFCEFDFTPPCFKSYLLEVDPEYKGHVEGMFCEAFLKLGCSEKLMLRPLIEVKKLKSLYKSTQGEEQAKIAKKIKAHLNVINENGDIQVLVKRFNIILLELHRKKSFKAIARLGADALLAFIEELKNSGELIH